MTGAIHHVAIAVPRIDDSLPFFRDTLGLHVGAIHELPDQQVRVVFLGSAGQRVELVEPTDAASGVARFVAGRGRATLHHICFVVDDLRGTLARLDASGVELIDAAPRHGALGEVAFVHPRASSGVLVELVDRASLDPSIP